MPVYLQMYCYIPEQHLQPQGRSEKERIPRLKREYSFVGPTALPGNAPGKKQKSQVVVSPRDARETRDQYFTDLFSSNWRAFNVSLYTLTESKSNDPYYLAFKQNCIQFNICYVRNMIHFSKNNSNFCGFGTRPVFSLSTSLFLPLLPII